MLFRKFSLLLCFLLTTQISAKSGRRKGELKQPPDWNEKTTINQSDESDQHKQTEDWNLKWFPFKPTVPSNVKKTTATSEEKSHNDVAALDKNKETEDCNLKWFPKDPKTAAAISKQKSQSDAVRLDNFTDPENWNLKWFPFKPTNFSFEKPKQVCDDGQNSIEVDFNPNDKRHSEYFLCLSVNRSLYEPNLTVEAILDEQFIPPAFVPPIKCLNESISYEFPLNTFGAFRPIPPQYGTYVYLPEQRWLNSIARGAVVMLYHPCASPRQVKILQDIVRSCLYRHIITPSQVLSPQRPLALLAWGKTLQMSVVDERQVIDFIKENSKHGPVPFDTSFSTEGSYAAGLTQEAKLITDIEDKEVCGYKNM